MKEKRKMMEYGKTIKSPFKPLIVLTKLPKDTEGFSNEWFFLLFIQDVSLTLRYQYKQFKDICHEILLQTNIGSIKGLKADTI